MTDQQALLSLCRRLSPSEDRRFIQQQIPCGEKTRMGSLLHCMAVLGPKVSSLYKLSVVTLHCTSISLLIADTVDIEAYEIKLPLVQNRNWKTTRCWATKDIAMEKPYQITSECIILLGGLRVTNPPIRLMCPTSVCLSVHIFVSGL